ncbi:MULTISPECIES: alpha/beta hydrolase [Mumia]|uniref:alpha/beta hydrolase n=1 Tax=Mumia TaxID=1546255 RepID=UPI0014230951|nr:alpha/beta hydrolase-fold protein [Mumia sp. ZJ430]
MSLPTAGPPAHPITRRRLLVGLGATVAVTATGAGAFAVGRDVLDGPDGKVPRVEGGEVIGGSFASKARRGRSCGWAIAWPPGHRENLPVTVVLHGRGNDHASAFSSRYLGLDRFLVAAVRGGAAPFALASVDGGESYWHRRADGDDAAAMVIDELLPLLERRGLRTERIGLAGWSMGGFGALHLARTLGRGRVAGVAVMRPALWRSYDDTTPGAYDDAADFARVSVMKRQRSLAGTRLRVDCGRGDPFYDATRDFVEGFDTRPAGDFERGGHDVGYWRRMAPTQLRFLAAAHAAADNVTA